MACGCGCGGSGSSTSTDTSASLGTQFENIIEGKKKVDLLEAIQMIAGIATVLLFVKYLFSK